MIAFTIFFKFSSFISLDTKDNIILTTEGLQNFTAEYISSVLGFMNFNFKQ